MKARSLLFIALAMPGLAAAANRHEIWEPLMQGDEARLKARQFGRL